VGLILSGGLACFISFFVFSPLLILFYRFSKSAPRQFAAADNQRNRFFIDLVVIDYIESHPLK